MKLQVIGFLGTFVLLWACESSVVYTPSAPVVGESGQSPDNEAIPAEENVAAVDDAANEGEAPAQNVPQALSNDDLLAMDEVVITAVVSADDTQYFSDIGNTAITTAESVADASQLPSGQRMTANAVLNLRVNQRMTFCSHASSVDILRVHSAEGTAFEHWGVTQVLNPGQCSAGLGFPEALLADAVGNTPGNNLYNHVRTPENSAIFVNIVQ